MTPVWLLDVDGVLNANRPGWGAAPRTGYATADGVRYQFRWAPKLISEIRDLGNSGLVEINWCTTWCAYIDQIESIFDLPGFSRSFTEDHRDRQLTLETKHLAAMEVIDTGRRLIWTDDDVIPTSGALFRSLTAAGSLLISPDWRKGLQPEHIDQIKEFLSAR